MSNIPGVVVNTGDGGKRHYFSFSEKYGMLINSQDKKSVVKQIEQMWADPAHPSHIKIENNTPFSPELQRSMANAMREMGVAPIRLLQGRFESLDIKESEDYGNSTELTLVAVGDDGEHQLKVQANTSSNAGAFLAIGAVSMMNLGETYQVSIYNVLDTRNPNYQGKKTVVAISNEKGVRLKSPEDKAYLFQGWVEAGQTAVKRAEQRCHEDRIRVDSQQGKLAIGNARKAAQSLYIEEMIRDAGLSSAISSSVPGNTYHHAPVDDGFGYAPNQAFAPEGFDDGYAALDEPMYQAPQQPMRQQPANRPAPQGQGYAQRPAPQQAVHHQQPRQQFAQQAPARQQPVRQQPAQQPNYGGQPTNHGQQGFRAQAPMNAPNNAGNFAFDPLEIPF